MKVLIFICLIFSNSVLCQVNHQLWTQVLSTHVSQSGRVNYDAIKKNPQALNAYIQSLQKNIPEESWNKNEKLAYWINAYNALTIDLILRHYPLNSIKDIKKPWDQTLWKFGDDWISLNDIEHKILRKMEEPRIHFAIVCASMSCPKLQNAAFTAKNLEQQLDEATLEFLNDTSKNKISKESLEISKIFRWFSKDFKNDGGVIDFIRKYSKIDVSAKAKINYLDYNWGLND